MRWGVAAAQREKHTDMCTTKGRASNQVLSNSMHLWLAAIEGVLGLQLHECSVLGL